MRHETWCATRGPGGAVERRCDCGAVHSALRTEVNALRAERDALRVEMAEKGAMPWAVQVIRNEREALRARVAELEVIAISICAGNCLPPFPCHQDGCPKRTASNKSEVRE